MFKKFSLFLTVLSCAIFSMHADKYIYFDTPSDWTYPRAYLYNNNGDNDWPGVFMTRLSDNKFCINVEDFTNVVFVKEDQSAQYPGSNQNWEIKENHLYNESGDTGNSYTLKDKITYIYYDNSSTKWDPPYAYCWNGGTKNNDWGGVPMTRYKDDVWRYEVADGVYSSVIFNNNDSDKDKEEKTNDYTLVSGNIYVNGESKDYSGTAYNDGTSQGSADKTFYLNGVINNWPWEHAADQWYFNKLDANTYIFTVTKENKISRYGGFAVNNTNKSTFIAIDPYIVIDQDTPYEVAAEQKNGSMSFAYDFWGTITLTANGSTVTKFTFTPADDWTPGLSNGKDNQEQYTGSLYLNYEVEGGEAWTSKIELKPENGYYKGQITISKKTFFILTNNGNHPWNGTGVTRYGADQNNNIFVNSGQIYNANKDDSKPWYTDVTGIYDVVVDMNSTPKRISFTLQGKQTTDIPSKLYLSTNISGNKKDGWKHGMEMAKNGNVFTMLITAENNPNISNYVCFFTKKHDKWPAGNADRIGSVRSGSDKNVKVTSGQTYPYTTGTDACWELPSKGTYFVTFDFDKKTVKFELDGPNDEFVYFNACADYYTDPLWFNSDGSHKKLYAHFYTNDNGNPKVYDWNKGVEMSLIDAQLPLFRAKIPSKDCDLCVSFSSTERFPSDDVTNELKYHSWNVSEAEKDAKNWKRFIYSVGKGVAYASYLTISDFYKRRAEMHTNGLYVIGHKQSGWNPTEADNYDVIRESEGVYIFDLTLDNKSFKISYINPNKEYTRLPNDLKNGGIQDMRAWATLNLGLIGPGLEYYDIMGKNTIGLVNDGDNKAMQCDYVQTYLFNHFNQFNWKVDNAQSVGSCLVIDIDFGTACMLPFNPQPKLSNLTATEGRNIFDLANEERTGLIDGIPDSEAFLVPGSETDGNNVAHFRFVNHLGVQADLTPAAGTRSLISEKSFEIDYTLSYEDESLGAVNDPDGLPKSIKVNSMVMPDKNEIENDDIDVLTARGLFTDLERYDEEGNNLKFRTNTVSSTIITDLDPLEKPAKITKIDTKVYLSPASPGYYDIFVGIEYEMKNNFILSSEEIEMALDEKETQYNYAMYPTFEVKINDSYAQLATEEEEKYFSDVLSEGYTWPDGGTVKTGSWAYNSVNAVDGNHKGYLPLVVRAAYDRTYFLTHDQMYSVEAKISACYPFFIYNEKNITIMPKTTPANSPRRASSYTPEDTNGTVVPVEKSITATLDKVGNVSGIEDVTVAGCETVIYNVQGIRVTDTNPAPGVYLRREADGSVSKFVIR